MRGAAAPFVGYNIKDPTASRVGMRICHATRRESPAAAPIGDVLIVLDIHPPIDLVEVLV